MPGNFDLSRSRMFSAQDGLASIMQGRRDAQSLAEIGAQRLAQYGPEGQQWADAFLHDPRGALLAAEQYGGMGAIEGRLASAAAEGQANTQMRQALSSSGLDAAGLEVFMKHGPAGYKSFIESQGQGAMGGFKPEDIRALRNDRQKVQQDFETAFGAFQKATAAGSDSPEFGQALTVLANLIIQPGNAVLEGEARATARSMQSLMEKLGVTVDGIVNPQADVGPEGRKRLLGMITRFARVAASDYKKRHEGWEKVNADLGITNQHDLFSRPGYERLDAIDRAFGMAPRESSGPVPVATQGDVDAVAVGTIVVSPSGLRGRKMEDGSIEVID